MNKKINHLIATILPNKRENIFILSLIILGIIAGTSFLIFLSSDDKTLITKQLQSFFINIQENKIDYGQTLINGLTLNISYLILMWLLGMSIIGLPINLFLVFFKSFIISFSLGALIYTYKIKGLFAAIIYTIPIQLINIIVITMMGIYTYNFAKNLIISLKHPQNNFFKKNFRKYMVILGITLILSTISVLLETYFYPFIMNLIINFFV